MSEFLEITRVASEAVACGEGVALSRLAEVLAVQRGKVLEKVLA